MEFNYIKHNHHALMKKLLYISLVLICTPLFSQQHTSNSEIEIARDTAGPDGITGMEEVVDGVDDRYFETGNSLPDGERNTGDDIIYGDLGPDGIRGTADDIIKNESDQVGEHIASTNSSVTNEDAELAPYSIEGMTLFAKDSKWEIYQEEIYFERDNKFSAVIINGDDNPQAQGNYNYSKYSSNTATLSYSATTGEGRYTFDYRLTFDDRGSGTYEKTADYGGGTIDETSGPFYFSSTTDSGSVSSANDPYEEDMAGEKPFSEGEDRPEEEGVAGKGADHDGHSMGEEHMPDQIEGLPISEVEGFVAEFASTIPELQNQKPVWAEKHFDAVKGKDRYVIEIGMSNGISLFFDQSKSFVHSAPSDEFAPIDVEFIPKSDINEKIITSITKEFKDVEVFDAEKEFSSLESDENSYITRVFFNADSKEYLANFTSANELIIVLEDRAGDFPEEWKPVTLPEKVKQYIKDNYGDIVDNTEYLPAEERPTADGPG